MTAQQLLIQDQIANNRGPPLLSGTELGDNWYDALGKINANFTTLFDGSELIAGSGIVLAGDTISVDQTFSPTWTGSHVFKNQVTFGQISNNYITATGANSGSAPALASFGASDASVSLNINTKGANGAIFLDSSKTNWVFVQGNSTGNSPEILAAGGDTNITLVLGAKGSGTVILQSEGVNAFQAYGPASSVNYLSVQAQTTGVSPEIQATGSDTSIGIALTPKGSGLVQFLGSQNFTANGTKAMSLGSTGPSAANASPQEWLTIQDNGGTTRYIPCF